MGLSRSADGRRSPWAQVEQRRRPLSIARALGAGLSLLLMVAAVVWFARSHRARPDLSLQRVQAAGVLVLGIDPSYPPFEMDDGHGHLAGFDVDVAHDLARRMGVRAEFVSIDFGSMFDALAVGKFDAVIGGVSPDPDYRKTISYSVPYYDDGLVLVEDPGVAARTLGIESGSDADVDLDQLRARLPGYRFVQFDDQSQIRASLSQQRIRGAILDAETATVWARERPGLVVEPRRFTSTPFVVAVRRGDQRLLEAIDQRLRAIVADGDVARFAQKWFAG